jgi:hypothetical protein
MDKNGGRPTPKTDLKMWACHKIGLKFDTSPLFFQGQKPEEISQVKMVCATGEFIFFRARVHEFNSAAAGPIFWANGRLSLGP